MRDLLYVYHRPRGGKTQVGCVVIMGRTARRCGRTNNVFPNGSPYCVLNCDEMTMRSPCWEAWEKHNGDSCV
jgi:hypothetical protein